MILPIVLVSLAYLVFTFAGLGSPPSAVDFGFAQIPNHDSIQITNTSTYMDESGNFHVVGEVNNTSHYPQTRVMITAVLSDSTNNVLGNFSAFSSLDVIRPGELSPFDIVADEPDIVGKHKFIEFSTNSQSGVEKPANLIINGSDTFLDNAGNLHITGNITNRGHSPESFLNLVGTFYDNSGHGIIGTQTYGLNVGNLPQHQTVPFDVTVTDNKTKSQGAFYSLNVESNQSSMSFPVNSKTSFALTGGSAAGGNGFAGSPPPLSGGHVGTANNNNEQTGTYNKDEKFRDYDDNNDEESVNNNNDYDGKSEGKNDDDNNDEESVNNDNDYDGKNDGKNDDGDNQRGEKKTDDNGVPWFDDNNCSEEPGSSGGDSSECEEAEREEQDEMEGEDPLEKEQESPSDSASTNANNENNDKNDEGNGDEGADNSEDKGEDGNDSSSSSN